MFNNDDNKKKTKKPGFNAQAFKHAISMVESSGGKFLKNKNSSAAGKYHFLYNSIKNDPSMKGISKQEFMNRPELQESIMDKALNGELENYPYGESYANKLQERYNSKYNVNELSALVHFLGPNNTRKFLKDPNSFNVPGKTNSTGQEYINKFQGFFDQYNIDNQVAPEVQPAPFSQYGSPSPQRRREDYPTQPIDNTRVAMKKPMIDMSVLEDPGQNIYDMDLNGTNAETEANINSFKQGGDLDSRSSVKDLVTIFEGGGSHKENPLGGIPQGTGSNGKPNLVEEGETKWNDYIFSNAYDMEGNYTGQDGSRSNVFKEGGNLTEPDPKDPKKLSPMAPVAPKPADNNVLSFLDNEYFPKPKVEKKPLMVVDDLFAPMSEMNKIEEERKKEFGEDNGFSYVKKIELGKERYKGERAEHVKYDNLVEENPKKGINFNSLLKNANNVYTWNDKTNTHDITPTGGGAANAFLDHYNHPITRKRLKEQIPGIDNERIDNMLIKGLKAEKHSGGAPDDAYAAYWRMGEKDQIFFRKSHLNNDATELHERVHASKMDDPLGVELQKILGTDAGPIGRGGVYNTIETRRYLNKPGETYANFAGFRQELGMKPGEQIDEKRMRQIMKDKKIESNFSNTYDDAKIVKALNTIAYQENNNNKEYRLS